MVTFTFNPRKGKATKRFSCLPPKKKKKEKEKAKRFSLLLNAYIVLPGKNDIVTSLGKIYGNLPLFRK